MNRLAIFSLMLLVQLSLFTACGPKGPTPEQQAALADSLRQDSLAKVQEAEAAKAAEATPDSAAMKAAADSVKKAEEAAKGGKKEEPKKK